MTLELQGRVALVTGASRGIGYAIAAGMTLTEGWISRHDAMAAQQGTTGEAVRDGMTKGVGIRLGRWAEASEIAQAAVFLASDRSSYITGQVTEVDGGLTKSVT